MLAQFNVLFPEFWQFGVTHNVTRVYKRELHNALVAAQFKQFLNYDL